MYFDKKKYIIEISGGKGIINTEKLRGTVVHMIVRPESDDCRWSMAIIDREGDELIEEVDNVGRLDDRAGTFLGKDDMEKVTIKFWGVTKNEPIKVIFKIREIA